MTRTLYALLAGVALAVALWLAHEASNAAEYQRGRREVLQYVRFDSVMRDGVAKRQRAASAKVDTVRVTVERIVERTRTVVQRVPAEVPDSVLRAYPVLGELTNTVTQLTDSIPHLLMALDAERTAARERFAVDSATVESARLQTIAVQDTLAIARDTVTALRTTLDRRPTWRTVVKATVIGGTLGAVCAKLCGPLVRAIAGGR
jgi:hypothetical protein